jgi:hypothetical protein
MLDHQNVSFAFGKNVEERFKLLVRVNFQIGAGLARTPRAPAITTGFLLRSSCLKGLVFWEQTQGECYENI